MKSVSGEFFSKGLISRDVRNSPSFDKIESEFVASLSLYEEDMTKLEEKCRAFVHCLAKASGPAKDAAVVLAEDWEREVMNKHSLKWSLKIDIETLTDLSLPLEIPLSSDDEVPLRMQHLHDKFISVMKHIRTYYNECKQYKVEDFARYLTDDYEEPLTKEPLTNCESFDILLHSVKTHYNFFNFDLIEDLANEFPLSDELQLELDRYVQELKQFKKSTALQQIKDAIKRVPLPYETSAAHSKIVIKLTGDWRKKTVKSLENLLQYLFERDSKRVRLIEIDDGSIMVMFLALSRAQTLIDKVQNKVQSIQYLGIFHISINNEVIIDREEDVNFTFEDSLLHAINHIDSDAEYERVALLLIELKIELNYQNTDDQTPLMLASIGGHIEIFNSLLQNGADPFVQLPSNKGYIGLNYLACTALCQHKYKSIGGERIIPRDDTSVEDMLEMAVKERGVSIYKFLYSPFIHIVKNYLEERIRWLQNCFHALNSSFHDVATNILTSKALVTEAKQNFQSYIKEDVNCESAHQLVQLLQPHYSCLNVDLLTIPCTITEPIKEQVKDYNTNLKMFKDTTSLLELAMVTKGMQYTDGVSCSKLILRLNKSWCSRTIAELNKMENFYLLPTLSFLNLIETHYDASSCTCTYFLPQLSQTESSMAAVFEQKVSLYAIGVFEVMIDDISIMMEDGDSSFSFKAALQEAHQTNNENVLFFLLELNITLPLENDNTDLMIASRRDFLTVQILLSKDPDINIQNNNGGTALMFASANGHHQVVELLLSKDPDINIQNNDGWTALMIASINGHHQVVELLLSKDPDINIQNNNGWTSLIAASGSGHHQVVELLLSKDPDINIQNNNGGTALMFASTKGHHQVAELLLSKDPNINIQKNDGMTALMFASAKGHHQVVELLLSKNPNINIQNNYGGTALMFASAKGHHQVVELLLSKDPNINIQKNDGMTALMVASINGHHQVVELLLSKDPDINIQNNDGLTALMIASINGHHQVVELLLSKDPDINIQNNDGLTALMIASINGHHQVVELLLSKDPDINIQNNNGGTALMFASAKGHHQVVELLLSKDPDINIQNNNGETVLMIASINGHHQVVELLLSKDPDINIQNNNGETVLMIASINGHHQVVELLLSKDPDINIQNNNGETALMFASANGHHQVVELLLSKDPDINIQNNDGETVLMIASINGHHQVVELLLSKDPDINIQNNDGLTALMFTSTKGHHQVVELLLSKDPDINIQNNGLTALMYASANGHHQVVELLLSKDPDINIQNNDGMTALMAASINGHHHQVVELLLSKDPDINIQNNNGGTALMFASIDGHHKVVELLLSKDPDINIQTNGVTALMFASVNGHHQIVELLLSKDPDINIQDNDGWTALMSASRYGYHQVVKLLLSKDPDINIQNNDGVSALMSASRYGYHQVVELLLNKDPGINIQNNDGVTALMFASGNGHHQVVELLLSKNPDINIQSNDGVSAFTLTLLFYNKMLNDQHTQMQLNNYIKILELLLEPHLNHIHTFGGQKFHSLALTALFNNFDAVTILMEKCDITPKNIISAFTCASNAGHSSMIIHLSEKITTLSNNERSLLVAAAKGDLGTLISMIYEVGMSPDTPLVAGITPLMIAASCGHIELVDTLIQAGTDVNKTNDEGMNALDIVNDIVFEFYDRSDIKELLITNTPAVEPDPVSNNDEITNKKPSTVSAIKSIFGIFNSFMKKAYNPYYSKQKELKIPYGVTDTSTPHSSMTSIYHSLCLN